MRALVRAAAVAALAGCGVDDLGVLSVEFTLEPAPPAIEAEGIDTAGAAAWSGDVHVDAVEGIGIVGAEGLPALEAPWAYRVTVGFAAGERDALPGTSGAGATGHTHGALVSDAHAGTIVTGFSDVEIGALDWDATNGLWLLRFFEDDAGGHPLGALRACVVWLDDDSGAATPTALLTGATGAAEVTGHVH